MTHNPFEMTQEENLDFLAEAAETMRTEYAKVQDAINAGTFVGGADAVLSALRWSVGHLAVVREIVLRDAARVRKLHCVTENAQESAQTEHAPDPYMDALHARLGENYKRQRESGCHICMENAKSLRGPCDEHPWPTEQSARDAAQTASEETITP